MNRYDELLKRLLAVCEALPEIKAVIIVGSQAREISKADEYSDLAPNRKYFFMKII